MKQTILIILSILLLSSPVIGDSHKGETLYGWGECLVEPCDYKWMGFGKKEIHPKFQGQVKDGIPNGVGILDYPDGDFYLGEWKNGQFHGQGTFTYTNGMKYEGEWKNGKPNGKGTETYSNGDKFLGEMKDGIWWNGTTYDKNGNIRLKFVNGKIIKQ